MLSSKMELNRSFRGAILARSDPPAGTQGLSAEQVPDSTSAGSFNLEVLKGRNVSLEARFMG
jgi:hypothetical protein